MGIVGVREAQKRTEAKQNQGSTLGATYPQSQAMPVGVVLRRSKGVTPWVKTIWRATSVLPGAGQASWKLIRAADGIAEFHATTIDVTLYVSDTEAYVHELQAKTPSVYVVLRDSAEEPGIEVLTVTVSPYEAQDYADTSEELVEKVPMPPVLHDWVARFVEAHHVEEAFVKRRRTKDKAGARQDGIGDARIAKPSDVYSVPHRAARESAE